VIRVGLARTAPTYQGLAAPWAPPNPVYDAVARALAALGLGGAEFGSPRWNPLGELVRPGGSVVLKPNFIRHWNPGPAPACTVASVITHGAVVRALADLAFRAVGERGRVTLAEAPQQDCDFSRIRDIAGLDAVQKEFAARGLALEMIDLRREAVTFTDGVITARRSLPGDPLGYREVDLGAQSFFHGSGLDARGFRGADYDPGPTHEHHSGGRHAYLLSESVLRADLIVNLPKWKTHKKTGVTLALKNLVGINGDKNWLPHHTVGAEGDEFPGRGALDRARSRAIDLARGWLARGRATGALRLVRRAESALRGDAFVRAGNWHGNRTTWRMVCDLNRCVYYSDAKGLHLDAPAPVRRILTVLDGIVAGEGEGPLAPRDVPLGLVLAGLDPVALDLAALRLMGFDAERIPKVCEPMRAPGPRITAVRTPEEVQVAELGASGTNVRALGEVATVHAFAPHSGWRGHVERARAMGVA
jgi:uncharacterized protein (DUF362 family)